jgi:hypothetical protein
VTFHPRPEEVVAEGVVEVAVPEGVPAAVTPQMPCTFSGKAAPFIAGLLDSVAMGVPSMTQGLDLFKNDRMFQSGQEVGNQLSLVMGLTRLAYARAAKVVSSVVTSGRTAVAARNTLKVATGHTLWAELGVVENRIYTYEQLLAKYGTDSAVRAAARRTNPLINVGAASNSVNRLSIGSSNCP